MPTTPKSLGTNADASSVDVIRAVHTRPGRIVLTADGAPDAWIASDVLVDIQA